MAELDDFAAYSRLADNLIERTAKEQLADVARLLALNCSYYQTRFGDVPQDVLLGMVKAEAPEPETATLLIAGMQNLISALAEARIIISRENPLDGRQARVLCPRPARPPREHRWRATTLEPLARRLVEHGAQDLPLQRRRRLPGAAARDEAASGVDHGRFLRHRSR
jgi:hypothetical protein